MTETHSNLTIGPAATVNEILLQHPETVSVFNTFGVDVCGGGDATLVDAASRDGADPNALIEALDGLIARGENGR